ncbi:hypothetical protein [Rufibacter quisquiliarum]|uniref:Uncharacterized protein n=1 Tax=Rufibacter quisquiliarum TaxID=1549639 RepID=A0A839GU43_9BACT|nr:hypothetical protein [Rufibacter quisquiliarum]MBA9078316.1 hypothetical protein [Rufibacter quisquiliarum]
MTKEEADALLSDKPEVQNVFIEALKGKGFNILTSEDQNKFVESERARIAAEKTSEIYSALDKDIAESSGLTKEPNEKTYDFAKRVIASFKEQYGTSDKTIKELQEKLKANASDETLKAQVEAYQKKEQEWQELLSQKDQVLFEKEVSIDLNKALVGFKPKPGLPESLVNLAIANAKAELVKSAKKNEDGSIVYLDAEGKPILGANMQPATGEALLSEKLKEYQDNGHKQTGAGAGGSSSGSDNTGTVMIPEGLKTKQEVTQFLIKAGVLSGTEQHQALYTEYIKKHPNLPLAA